MVSVSKQVQGVGADAALSGGARGFRTPFSISGRRFEPGRSVGRPLSVQGPLDSQEARSFALACCFRRVRLDNPHLQLRHAPLTARQVARCCPRPANAVWAGERGNRSPENLETVPQ